MSDPFPQGEPEVGSDMSIWEHLGELRRRIFYALGSVFAFACASFYFSKEIFDFLTRPFFSGFPASSLIGLGPAEPIVLRCQIAIFAGIFLAIPIILYHAWRFVAPGLYDTERRMVIPLVGVTSLLFMLGATFCFTVIAPLIFQFLAGQYSFMGLTPQIRVSEQVSFLMQLLVIFGVMFELPVAAGLLARAELVTHRTLLDYGRHAVVAIFVVSAFITPPDVVSQVLVAIPLLILYGISIGIAYLVRPAEVSQN